MAETEFSATEKADKPVSSAKPEITETENSEETIRRILHHYDLGHKIRQLRLRKKIALVDLGKHTGLSASMLSQLENGKLIPTLPTLARIAMVFDVGIEHFFSDVGSRRVFSIVRGDSRLRFPDNADSPTPGYYFEVLAYGATEKNMSAYWAEFPKYPERSYNFHRHDGSEFVHVISGTLEINYQAEDHVLNAGDSVYFDASEPHAYSGLSTTPAAALVVTMPPRL